NEAELAKAREDIADARLRWQSEVASAVAAAEMRWRSEQQREREQGSQSGDAALIAELRTRCEQAEAALEKARTRAALQAEEIAKDKGAAEELAQLKEKYALLQSRFANRGRDPESQEKQNREIEAAVARARSTWEAEAARRLHAAEAKLRVEAETRFAKADAQWQMRARQDAEDALKQASAAEVARDAIKRKLEETVAAAMVTERAVADGRQKLAEAEKRIAEAQARAERAEAERGQLKQQLDTATISARGEWLKETEDRLREAENRLKAEADARLADAEKTWQARALAERESAVAAAREEAATAARTATTQNAASADTQFKQQLEAALIAARAEWLKESEGRLREAENRLKAEADARAA